MCSCPSGDTSTSQVTTPSATPPSPAATAPCANPRKRLSVVQASFSQTTRARRRTLIATLCNVAMVRGALPVRLRRRDHIVPICSFP